MAICCCKLCKAKFRKFKKVTKRQISFRRSIWRLKIVFDAHFVTKLWCLWKINMRTDSLASPSEGLLHLLIIFQKRKNVSDKIKIWREMNEMWAKLVDNSISVVYRRGSLAASAPPAGEKAFDRCCSDCLRGAVDRLALELPLEKSRLGFKRLIFISVSNNFDSSKQIG